MAQRLYLLVSAVLMAIVSQSRLAQFVTRDYVTYELTCWTLSERTTGEVVSNAPWALMVLAIGLSLLSLFTLFLVFYQNYALQKRLTIYNMLVTVGFLLTYAAFFFYYKSHLDVLLYDVTWWAIAVPVVVLILLFMAFLAIRKKEASVIFEASSFRLRD